MSRRIFQTFQSSLRLCRPSQFRPLHTQATPLSRSRGLSRPIPGGFVRRYVTENPRGVPIDQTPQREESLSAAEKERNELHKEAQQKVESNLPDEAIAIYSTLLSRSDLTPLETRLATFNLGVIHHRKGDINKALEYWEAVAEKPIKKAGDEDLLGEAEEMELCASANMNLGAHFVLSKEMQKGESYLRRAAELDPHDGEVRYNLAATLAAMGKIEAAITEFEAAEERGIEIARKVIDKLREGMKENSQRKGE